MERAIAQLRKSLAYGRSELASRDPDLAVQFRAAAILAFECTYELSWKMLKRHLESVVANPSAVDAWSFADLIRSGNEHGLLRSDWPVWRDYRKAFEESELPFRVDVVDWAGLGSAFREAIARDAVPLDETT